MLDAGQINAMFFDQRADRLKIHQSVIEGMLSRLPWPVTGGLSAEEACCDKEGKEWSSYSLFAERLLELGIALGKVRVVPGEPIRYELA